MAVDLPPVIPPQLSAAEKIRAQLQAEATEAVIATQVGGYKVAVTGNRYLSSEQVKNLFESAADASAAIRGLNAAYYKAGHLLITLYYAVEKERILVHVINGSLAAVEAPEAVSGYFQPLVGDTDLTMAEFDRRRVMADIKSRRAGLDYSVSYRLKGDPTAYTLILTEKAAEDFNANSFQLRVGNQGNRFLGRYFAGAGYQRDLSTGGRFNLNYDRAVPEFGSAKGGKRYEGVNIKFSTPTRWGLYGAEVSRIEYERQVDFVTTVQEGAVFDPILGIQISPGQTVQQDASADIASEVLSVALNGEQVLASKPTRRFSLFEKLRKVDAEIEGDGGQRLLDEHYTALSVGIRVTSRAESLGKNGKIAGRLLVDAGFGESGGTLESGGEPGSVSSSRRSADFLIWRGNFASKGNIGTSEWLWGGALNFQLAGDRQLPQQEQFVLGGIDRLSAYLPGVLVGDEGAYGKIELSRNTITAAGLDWTPSVFLEYGTAQYSDADAALAGDQAGRRSISDLGVRLKAEYGDALSMEFVLAESLSENRLDSRFLAATSSDFFWRIRLSF